MVVGAVLKNILYPVQRIVHKAIRSVVRYEEAINRYRDLRTGQFISRSTYNRSRSSLKYWNSIRAIVRNAEYGTFEQARSSFKYFKRDQPYMTEQEITDWHQDKFGSP